MQARGRRTSSNVAFDAASTVRHSSLQESSLEPTVSEHSSSSALLDSASSGRRHGSVPSAYHIGRSNSPVPPDDDDEEVAYASTPYSLDEWSTVAKDRQKNTEKRLNRKRREQLARTADKRYDAIYQQLLALVNAKPLSKWDRFLSLFGAKTRSAAKGPPIDPETEKPAANVLDKDHLVELAKYCYPPRFSARAMIFDFGDGKTEYHTVEVGKVEESWRTKPEWSTVRWIHIPFGRGVAHSSIEDIFRHDHPIRRKFTHGGDAAWPYLQTESLNFRSRYDFKRMRDVYLLLHKEAEVKKELNKTTFLAADPEGYLEKDMRWRADYIGTTLDYWDLCQTDMPNKLPEGGGLSEAMLSNYQFCMMGPRDGLKPLERDEDEEDIFLSDSEEENDDETEKKTTKDLYKSLLGLDKPRRTQKAGIKPKTKDRLDPTKSRQAIEQHPFFKGSQLVRNDFRAFHGDQFLLTMSAANGVDFLDREFQHYLGISGEDRLENTDATCIGRIWGRFESTGCRTWHRRTAEWLLVHVISEIAMAPNPFNMGMIAPTLGEAYQAIVLDLNRRKYDKWQRNETVQLVRDMLACGDELNILSAVFRKRVRLLEGTLKDCMRMEAEDVRHVRQAANAAGEDSVSRVRSALMIAEEDLNCLNRLLDDVKATLGSLFTLRQIQQDELAQLQDKQNRSVLVFTVVTVIFLPLSFFTSYFGMNLSDIADDQRTEGFFWKLCGSIAFVIVLFILVFGYRHRVDYRNLMFWRQKRMNQQRSWYPV